MTNHLSFPLPYRRLYRRRLSQSPYQRTDALNSRDKRLQVCQAKLLPECHTFLRRYMRMHGQGYVLHSSPHLLLLHTDRSQYMCEPPLLRSGEFCRCHIPNRHQHPSVLHPPRHPCTGPCYRYPLSCLPKARYTPHCRDNRWGRRSRRSHTTHRSFPRSVYLRSHRLHQVIRE